MLHNISQHEKNIITFFIFINVLWRAKKAKDFELILKKKNIVYKKCGTNLIFKLLPREKTERIERKRKERIGWKQMTIVFFHSNRLWNRKGFVVK